MPTPIILDCDPGHDDALAILLAAADPAIDLLAITTVAGNQTLDRTTLNTRRICSAAGITDVPIAAGRAEPLGGNASAVGAEIGGVEVHGESGLDGPSFGPPTVELSAMDAIALMREILLSHKEPVTLVPTGPLTNIAVLLRDHPEVLPHIARIVLMGGATGLGNVTPAAEFNIYCDPEAAELVFTSGLPITMCGLDITHQALATQEVCDRIAAIGTPLATLCVELLTFFASTYKAIWGFPAPPLHDPVAIARLIDPALVTTVPAAVAIELTGEHTRGATVVDFHGVTGRPVNAEVATTLDVPGFWDLITSAVATLS
ncbi:nucleoside hydrolase [Allokutzneria albata]|uniref:Pyrimidine-specific ribonucleoside hydrolase n=1 Tax=Allokutzneria albata TaxID=211114 RepID=A0A1H0BI89_ALLAB|nr:nucleoside hydrolase [Allokutzneria albata]SDN45374.1 pyrimidine-specific ribonucleoside hydrolase [Allokutzneria albata]